MNSGENIRKQRDIKYDGLVMLAKRRFKHELENQLSRIPEENQTEINSAIAKNERKLNNYLVKKRAEYDRRAQNEIDNILKEKKLPKKVKIKRHNNLLEELMSLMQLYVRYRDTDENGQGFCISC